jgi:tetratricopeptide (TPR) repeat protein
LRSGGRHFALALAFALAVSAPAGGAATVAEELQPLEVLFNNAQFADAERLLDDLLRRHPGHVSVLEQQMRLRFFQQRHDEVLAIAARLLAANPRNLTAVNLRGLIKMERGNLSGALADFEHAPALNPNFAKAALNRARALRPGPYRGIRPGV